MGFPDFFNVLHVTCGTLNLCIKPCYAVAGKGKTNMKPDFKQQATQEPMPEIVLFLLVRTKRTLASYGFNQYLFSPHIPIV